MKIDFWCVQRCEAFKLIKGNINDTRAPKIINFWQKKRKIPEISSRNWQKRMNEA